jgi:hypothetical protein
VANEAAHRGFLPADFSQWGLVDNGGWTVAHAAAREGHLPADFNQWTLADNDGWTVAHTAATYGHLPADFNQWGLVNNDGLTVLRQLLLSSAKSDKYTARWEKEGPLCKTDADWEVFKIELPEIYQKYSISGCMPDDDKWEALLL